MEDADVIAVCGLRFEAAIAAGPGVRVLRSLGMPEEAIGELKSCAGIISFGCAGGLDPMLRAGDCMLPEAVQTPEGAVETDAAWRAALRHMLPYASGGLLAGVSAPCSGSADKDRLRRLGARAVDMESHRAALAARRLGIPFAVLRVIADPAARSIPSCALAGLRDDELALAPVLRALAAHPTQLPALLMLAVDALAAKRTLLAARALAGGRFSLPGH